MSRFAIFLACAAVLIWAILAGPLAPVLQGILAPAGRWLLAAQAQFQNGMAQQLRGVHGGQMAAFWALMGLCLAYGFVHAAGPGHGKALLGAYGVARRVPAGKLAGIGLLAALAQGSMAVVLVLTLAGLAGLGRREIEALDRGALSWLALAAMLAVGLWLLWRALTRLGPSAPAPAPCPPQASSPDGPAARMLAQARTGAAPAPLTYAADAAPCPDCGHAHLPPPEALLRASTPREIAALVAAVAVRPCSGALVLLLLSWQMGLLWVGIAGTYAMALGTGGVAVMVALALALGREGLLWGGRGLTGGTRRQFIAAIEALAGLALVLGVLSVVIASR